MLQSGDSSTSYMTSTFSAANGSVGTVPEECVVKQVWKVIPWDNKDNLISKQTESLVNILLLGICLPLCFLVSLCTNLVNMAVFCKQGLKERINVCLFTLSLMDLLYVSAVYCLSSDILYMFAIGKADEPRPMDLFFFKYHLVGLIGSGQASQVLSSVIALERCVCITHPLLAKNLMSTRKTAMLLWCVSLALIAGSFVSGMRYSILCVFDPRNNRTFLQYFPSEFYLKNKHFIDVLDGVIYGSLLPGVCGGCVIVCTVIIVFKMKKLSLWREKVSSASDSLTSRDLAITRMIVGTSVLFIVCIVPSMAVRVLMFLIPGLKMGGRYENLYSVFIRIYLLASVINSSFNFFVYYVYGSKFRQTVRELFLSCTLCRKKAPDGHIMGDQ